MKSRCNCLVWALIVLCHVVGITSASASLKEYVTFTQTPESFPVAHKGKAAAIYVDPDDWKGVIRAANDVADDVRKVTGTAAKVTVASKPGKGVVVVGTIGKSQLIDELVAKKKLDVSALKGQWESYLIQTVDNNLVIAGSDKRGTIFGLYDLSENIGVSPWYWWADVPVPHQKAIYVKNGRYVQPSPAVKYRGLFINDEEPSFGGWARASFGGINSNMYTHLFELLLRLKANYMWPAMWGKAFNEDDPLNPVLADEYGIVMGTSHHEPMMRAQQEYTKRKATVGPWDYAVNKERLDQFFTEGLERNKRFDNLITIGMRGEGDVALSKEGDVANMRVLGEAVQGQRAIIQSLYGKNPAEVPQLWAIFTEVQRYYDAGFTVPDDVLLLFCDNNWGYIRRTGPLKEQKRPGGMGLYYHIDMNGGPWNDRWVNTTTIPKLYEQFNLAYRTGLDDLWIINVGDLKPKEYPIDFILRYAWNPDAYTPNNLHQFTVDWATRQFGTAHAEAIADIVSTYSKYNLWRKPEVQDTRIFSYVNHREADRVAALWQKLMNKVDSLKPLIAREAQDAFYQLVYYPAKASSGVANIYLEAGRNQLYAKQGRVSANDHAEQAKALFELDKQLSDYYNTTLANGKWKHMMSDVHIGYSQWSMPRANTLPALTMVTPLNTPTLGVAIEGSELAWPGPSEKALLPTFDAYNRHSYYIDVFNKGVGSFSYAVSADQPWVKLSTQNGTVEKESRLLVDLDWDNVPNGLSESTLTIRQGETVVHVGLKAMKTPWPETDKPFFGALSGEFSIPANHFSTHHPGKHAKWIILPDLGRSEACMGIHPVTAPSAEPSEAPRLDYSVYLPNKGKTTVCLGILPTQDVQPQRGLRIAIGLNNEPPIILDARKGLHDEFKEYTQDNLSRSKVLKPLPPINRELALVAHRQPRRNEVFDNQRWLDVELDVKEPGLHTLSVYMVDPEVVLETIVINPNNQHPSYFGAPAKAITPPKTFRYTNPITRDASLSMRDHCIIKVGDTWYCTGTSYPVWTGPNPGVRLLVSNDLLHWEHHSWLIDAKTLPTNCPYNGRFWAPEIHYIQGRYWLNVNSGKVTEADPKGMATHSIWLFRADEVTGPYSLVNGPLTPQYNNDATLFEDEDGQVYLFCSGNGLFQAKIDLQKGTLTTPITKFLDKKEAGYPSWMMGGIEGPYVLKRDGNYFMFFSTWTRGYEVGLLTAPSPLGPWSLVSNEPIFGTRKKQYRPELAVGGGYDHLVFQDTQDPYCETGHNSLFMGPDGQLWSACHYLMYEKRSYPYSQPLEPWELTPQLGIEPIQYKEGRFFISGPTWTEQHITLKQHNSH